MPPSQAPRVNRPAKNAPPKSLKIPAEKLLISVPKNERSKSASNMINGAILAFFAGTACSQLGLLDLVPPLRGVQFTGLVFLGVGALLGRRHLKVVLVFTGLTTLLLLTVAYTPISKKLSASLVWHASPAEIEKGADAVMVLGSWVQGDGTFTSPSLARLMGGLELVRQKHAPVLVLSEIKPPAGSYAKSARDLAAQLEMPLNVQSLPGYVYNTRDEAVGFATLAKNKGWKRVFLVTSPTHTKRATLMFRRAAQEQKLQVLPVPCAELDADLKTLDDPGDRIRVFKWCLREIVGLIIYGRRGWI